MTTESVQMSIPEIKLPQRAYLARDKAGMTQSQLAEAMGVTRKTITNIETGAGSARRPTLAAWALATGVPLAWLENGENPSPNGPGGVQSTDFGLKVRSSSKLSYRGRSNHTHVVPLRRPTPAELDAA